MNRYVRILLIAIALLFLTGCFALPVEDDVLPPPIVRLEETIVMQTVPVMRGDVINYINPVVSYVAAREERLSFEIDGHRLMGIYVNVGDTVEAGDLIAAVYWPYVQNRMQAALTQRDWVRISLGQLDERQANARRREIATGDPVDEHFFRIERHRLNRELEILNIEINYLEQSNRLRYLRAGMSGTVTQAMTFTPGMTAPAISNIAIIADQTHSLFVLRPIHEELPINIGDHFTLTANREPFTVVNIDPDEFGVYRGDTGRVEFYFAFVDDAPIFIGNPAASIHIVLDQADNVLLVPRRAVTHTGQRSFVLVYENGVRVRRDIEVGLRGNHSYEIISGLEEGELVVLG